MKFSIDAVLFRNTAQPGGEPMLRSAWRQDLIEPALHTFNYSWHVVGSTAPGVTLQEPMLHTFTKNLILFDTKTYTCDVNPPECSVSSTSPYCAFTENNVQ